MAPGSQGTTIKISATISGSTVDAERIKTAISNALGRNGVPLDPARIVVHEPTPIVDATSSLVVVEILPTDGEHQRSLNFACPAGNPHSLVFRGLADGQQEFSAEQVKVALQAEAASTGFTSLIADSTPAVRCGDGSFHGAGQCPGGGGGLSDGAKAGIGIGVTVVVAGAAAAVWLKMRGSGSADSGGKHGVEGGPYGARGQDVEMGAVKAAAHAEADFRTVAPTSVHGAPPAASWASPAAPGGPPSLQLEGVPSASAGAGAGAAAPQLQAGFSEAPPAYSNELERVATVHLGPPPMYQS